MSTPSPQNPTQLQRLDVGETVVDPRALEILADGKTHRLEPKTLGVLLRLAESAGQPVTRDELFAAVWPDTHVSEDVLNRCVYQLRRILGDDPKRPRYIETIPKVGYRLIAAVRPSEVTVPVVPPLPSPPASPSSQPAQPSPRRAIRASRWIPFAVGLILAISLFLASAKRASVPKSQESGEGALQGNADTTNSLRLAPLVVDADLPASVALDASGRRAAYSARAEDGSWNLFERNLETGQTQELTHGPENDHGPGWSPDGDELAWIRTDRQDSSCWLMRLSLPAGSERRIHPCPASTQPRLDWSPDGKYLVFAGRNEDHEPLRVHLFGFDDKRDLTISEPPAGTAGDFGAVFSRDGQKVVFARNGSDGRDELFSVDLSSGEESRLTELHGVISGFDVSPNGSAIYFAAVTEQLSGLWSVSAEGGEPQWLGYLGTNVGLLDFPVSGTHGALIQTAAQVEWLQASLENDGEEAEPRSLSRSRRFDWFPALSPGGESLALISDRLGSPELWLRSKEHPNGERRTFFDGQALGPPQWSPDGRQLVFDVRRGDTADLYRLDLGHDRPIALTIGSGKNLQPHFSADGRSIVFASDRSGTWQLWSLPSGAAAGDEPASQLTTDGATSPVVSPRGDWIYFVRPGANGLWRLPASGGPSELWLEDFPPPAIEEFFATTEGLFLAHRESDENTQLRRWDEASRQWQKVRDLGLLPPWPSVALSRDASSVAWSRILEIGSVIEAVEGLP